MGTGAALLTQVKQSLAGSPIANQVLSALEDGHGRVDAMPDAQFNKLYAGAAGVFVPAENRIIVPASVANNPEKVKLILLHESVHWLQDNVKGGAAGLGGPLQQALAGANAIRTVNPNTKAGMWHDEAQAYMMEALVASQLGLQDGGLGTLNGKVLSYDQVIQRIAAEPIYN